VIKEEESSQATSLVMVDTDIRAIESRIAHEISRESSPKWLIIFGVEYQDQVTRKNTHVIGILH